MLACTFVHGIIMLLLLLLLLFIMRGRKRFKTRTCGEGLEPRLGRDWERGYGK